MGTRKSTSGRDRRRKGGAIDREKLAGSKSRSLSGFLPVLLVLLAAAAYANSMQGAFVFDDLNHITRNPRVQQLFPLGATLSGRRPTLDLSLAINYAIGGKDTTGYHIVNLAIHILAGLTLFGVIRRTMLHVGHAGRLAQTSSRLAFAISLIWLVHPLQTESVTYLVQRCESMMGLFYLLTIYCLLRAAPSTRAWLWYVLAVVTCALGMASKAIMVTAPIAVLLYDRIFLARSWRSLWNKRWHLYSGLAATWGILWLCGIVQSLLNASNPRATVGLGFTGITPVEYLLTQPGVILYYLRLSFWPHPLCLDYAWPVETGMVSIILSLVVILVAAGGALLYLLRGSWIGFVGVWFFLILSPTSSIIPIRDPLFEHRMYLPLAAIVTFSVLAWHGVAAGWCARAGAGRLRRLLPACLLMVTTVALGTTTIRRNQDYQTELGMWRDIVAKSPNNARGHYSLGTVLLRNAKTSEAIEQFGAAIRIDPAYVDAHYNLGNALQNKGRVGGAIKAHREAIRLDPKQFMARLNLANLLQGRTGSMEEAVRQYREALRTKPDLVMAHVNLGKALLRMGRSEEAMKSFRRAVLLAPNHPGARFGLALALDAVGRLDAAIKEYRDTLRLQPGNIEAARSLEAALAKQGGP
ncbi:MAG: tetratricopeptide repeat protein [Planctomycetes bacterium]|nr:tetratricopeptide repeat protein [Planctomycetota bacterium]